MIGSASYNEFFKVSSTEEFIYKIPLKVVYFLFSPFPWDVKKFTHIIAMFDGFLYMLLVYLILKNLKTILKDPFLRIILIILICYFVMFAIGVSNFGAGLRHRTKFVMLMVLLVSPFIPNIVFVSKNKLRKTFKNKS
jgi:hypothetical protein